MRLDEVFVIPAQGKGNLRPLKDSDSIRVYHGTSSPDLVYAALTKGISGGSAIARRYSYESNNNPRGLFVTPDLKTAKEFGSYIIEFHTRVKDLEAPVWPGGMFTGQGGMSGIFNSPDEREQERLRQRMRWSQDEMDYVRDSDRPELAATLLSYGERQALFIGDLNKNSIRAVWVSSDPSRVGQTYNRISPKEFIQSFETHGIETPYSGKQTVKDYKDSEFIKGANRRIVEPREDISGEEFLERFIRARQTFGMDRKEIIRILIENPDYVERHVWSERQSRRILSDLKRIR